MYHQAVFFLFEKCRKQDRYAMCHKITYPRLSFLDIISDANALSSLQEAAYCLEILLCLHRFRRAL